MARFITDGGPEADTSVGRWRDQFRIGRILRAGRATNPWAIAGLTLVYFAAGKLGLRFAVIHPSASAVWPPSGIALAACVLLGYGVWPGVFLGALLVNVTTAGSLLTGTWIAAGNTIEALTGTYLVVRFANGHKVFERARDIFKFAVLAGALSTMIGATVGVTAVAIGGYAAWSEYWAIWLTWWLGDAAGDLILAPLLVLWCEDHSVARNRLGELLLLLISTAGVGVLVFDGFLPAGARTYPIGFMCIPTLVWAAFRFGQREGATAVAVLSATAVWGTFRGFGPFAEEPLSMSLVLLQAFIATMAFLTLPMAAVVWERRRAEAEAKAAFSMLRKLQSVTDSTLYQVGLEEMLRDVLREVRAQLESDTATVLLLDSEGRYLTPIASDGLREEVRREEGVGNMRVPVGRGVTGKIALSEDGMIFDDLSKAEVMSPFLRGRVKSLAGAPLKMDGRTIGVIHVGSTRARRFTRDDLALLRLVARRAAPAIEGARMHEQERSARQAAETESRAKDEFLAMLGHELRNPLAALSSSLYVLENSEARSERATNARAIISRQTQHLTRLVDDLLDVGRATIGRIKLQRRPINLADCVNECVGAVGQGKKLEHEIRTDVEPVWVNGDPDRIAQMLMNLLSNAIKYTGAGGKIVVSARPDGDVAVIRVADNGIGITPDVLPHVFDLFVQGKRGLDRSHGGMGIGLTLVRRLAELHGGSAEAASDGANRGSRFTIRLPRIAAPSAIPVRARPTAAPSGSRRVLIVEDNVDAREGLRTLLELSGHTVAERTDGPSAIEAVNAFDPDIALIDIGLPGLDGYEVARRIRSDPNGNGIVLIALTGYGQPEDRQAAERAGFDAHLVKPVDPRYLMELVATAGERAERSVRSDRR